MRSSCCGVSGWPQKDRPSPMVTGIAFGLADAALHVYATRKYGKSPALRVPSPAAPGFERSYLVPEGQHGYGDSGSYPHVERTVQIAVLFVDEILPRDSMVGESDLEIDITVT